MVLFTVKELNSYKKDYVIKDYKSVIISIGVLGTFIGIVIGLYGFDIKDIDKSLPTLLNGLKTAFITSIGGMIFSIFLTIIGISRNAKPEGMEDILHEISAKLNSIDGMNSNFEKLNNTLEEQVHTLKPLENIDRNIIEQNKIILENITNQNELHVVISDTINSNFKALNNSLEPIQKINDLLNISTKIYSEIVETKTTIEHTHKNMSILLNERLNDVIENLREAVKTLSKGATEEIVEALNNVIKDFNFNLTEQFGKNFKELNEAVFKLVDWQENNKNQVEQFENTLQTTMKTVESTNKEMTELFKKESEQVFDNFEKLTKSTEYINRITKDYETISSVSKELEEILKLNNNQMQNFETHTNTLIKLGEDAKTVTNEIKDFSTEIQESISRQSSSIAEMSSELEKELPKALDLLNKHLTSISAGLVDNYAKFADNINNNLPQPNNQ